MLATVLLVSVHLVGAMLRGAIAIATAPTGAAAAAVVVGLVTLFTADCLGLMPTRAMSRGVLVLRVRALGVCAWLGALRSAMSFCTPSVATLGLVGRRLGGARV